jgi:glucosyl-3-phosphoglycerate synthase
MLTVWDWFGQRSFHHGDFSDLASPGMPRPAVTLILPTREVAGTIGPILDTVARLNDRSGLVSQIVVVDADSADGTANIARGHGAEVYSENELRPEFGPAQGKGDAMWRALSVARGDIIMYADTDTTDFAEHFIYGTLGPLLRIPGVKFAKAAYRRPFASDSRPVADGGGRVTELMAKPLLNFFYPELTGFVQPLAGEFAVSRDLLLRTPFLTGYGVRAGRPVPGRPGLTAEPASAAVRPDPDELGRPARAGPAGTRAGGAGGHCRLGTADLPARGGHRGRATTGRAPHRAA